MLILGIDPGSRITGFGVVSHLSGRTYYVGSGCIRGGNREFPERLRMIYQGIKELVEIHKPDAIAIEQVFMSKNPDSALKLGQARGAAMVAGANRNLDIFEYSARQIKQAVAGRGNADKQQIQHMVAAILKLDKKPQPDAADALAAALCHIYVKSGLESIMSGYRSGR